MLDDNLPPDYVEELDLRNQDELTDEEFEEVLAECDEADFSGSLLNDDER